MTEYLSPTSDNWYLVLLEDLRDIITEREFNARWEKILGKWEIGKRIIEDNPNFERKYIYGKEIATVLARSLDCSRRDIYRCIKFARKYPNLNTLPEGKAITWNKIITRYLTNNKNKGEENDNKSKSGGVDREKIDNQEKEDLPEHSFKFSSPEEYKRWVQSQPCCVCDRPSPSTFAHFPVTKARKDEHWGIPLCGICHREQEDGGANWCWDYRRKWAKFLFDLIIRT